MLKAERTSFWRSQYRLTLDGAPLTDWDSRTWKSGGRFTLDGRDYEVGATSFGTKYRMTDAGGTVLAEAARVGRKNWTVHALGREYVFQRASVWRNDQNLMHDGVVAGTIRRPSSWSSTLEADLPGMPLPVQIFIVGVMIAWWDAQSAAAAA